MISYDLLLACLLALVAWALVRLARVVEAHRRQLERQGYGLREAIENHTRALENYTHMVQTMTASLPREEIDV